MSDDHFTRASEIFDRVESWSVAERERYLDQTCAAEPDLRREVESLLAARDRLGGFLDSSGAEWIGRKIGTCTIQGLISEGGMGVVLRATQNKPRRTVAVKLIKGPAFEEVTQQRFLLEAEALGRLDHPGIACIHEVGFTERDGRPTPYFVMEYIEGLALIDHVAREQLDVESRLRLMIAVCEAVHHAHLRGVIHRDLKPSNIIVRPDGQPKVLDFGIARITDADLALTTMHTHVGQILGTLSYMSPEQVKGRHDALDLRSDVYSLGVLLFEILTGRLPLELKGTELVEAAMLIVDQSPAALGLGEQQFSEDLETIVAKCLRKEPERRYDTAAHLAADLERFLKDEPILARPPSKRYQWKKFAKRNRSAVASAIAALTILVVGLVVSLAGWSAADRASREAESAAAEASSVSDFLTELLSAPDPYVEGTEVRVVDLLERAAQRAVDSRIGSPRVSARIHQVLGETYRGLGLYPEAIAQKQAALTIALHESDASNDVMLASPLIELANLHLDLFQFAAADSLYEKLIAIAPRLAPDSRDRFRLAQSMGARYDMGHEFDRAISVLEPALHDARAFLGPEHVLTVDLQSALGNVLWQSGEPERARELLESSLATMRKERETENPGTLPLLNNLAMIYQQLEDYPHARQILEDALAAKQRLIGSEHVSTAAGHHNLAHVLRILGEYELAILHHETGIAIVDTTGAIREPQIYVLKSGYAHTLLAMDQFEEARAVYEECYQPLADAYGADHPRVISLAESLASICLRSGDQIAADHWLALSKP